MASVLDEIEAKVRALKPEERAQLLRLLIADLDGPSDRDAGRAWLETAQRRHAEIVESTVKTIPADQVFRKVRSRLKG